MNEKKYFLNPVTLICLIVTLSVLLMFCGRVTYLGLTVFSFIIAFFTNKRVFIKTLIAYLIMYGLSYLMHMSISDNAQFLGAIYSMLIIVLKLMSVWVIAALLSEHTSSELMHAFRILKFPINLTVGIAVFFRFVPEFFSRLKDIKQGAKIRGYGFDLLHPIRTFELFAVPLMFRALTVSDTVSCSIITKGIEYKCKKTPYRAMPFTVRDVIAGLIVLIFVGGIVWKGY